MERLNLQARVARELPQLEQEFVKVKELYSLCISFDVHVEPEEMALYQTLTPSFHGLKVCNTLTVFSFLGGDSHFLIGPG